MEIKYNLEFRIIQYTIMKDVYNIEKTHACTDKKLHRNNYPPQILYLPVFFLFHVYNIFSPQILTIPS